MSDSTNNMKKLNKKIQLENNKEAGFSDAYLLIPLVVTSILFSVNLYMSKAIVINQSDQVATIDYETPTVSLSPLPIVLDSTTPMPLSKALYGPATPSPTPTPKHSLSPTPTTSLHSPSSGQATSSVFPMPTTLPARCSTTLKYKVGQIDGDFYIKGFDRDRLAAIVDGAAKQWNDAIGMNLFQRTNDAPNVINFTSNSSGAAINNGDYAHIDYSKVYSNGMVGGFTISFYDFLFYILEKPDLSYYGEPVDQDKLLESIINRIVLHMMGRAFGLSSNDNVNQILGTSIMSGGEWMPTSYLPTLLTEDKELGKKFCQN